MEELIERVFHVLKSNFAFLIENVFVTSFVSFCLAEPDMEQWGVLLSISNEGGLFDIRKSELDFLTPCSSIGERSISQIGIKADLRFGSPYRW